MNLGTPWKNAQGGPQQGRLLAGVELGGTKIICTLGSDPDRILASERIPTDAPDIALAAVESVLDKWFRDHATLAGLGIASFGPLEIDPDAADYGKITRTTKPGWSDVDVAGRFGRRYDVPLGFDTDVNGAALAEGRWGAARGFRSWIYITIGTGVGAGIVVNGETVRGLGHSEAGHMLVGRRDDGIANGICPFHGDCVEGLVSGPAIAARTGLTGEAIPDDHPIWESVSETIGAMLHNLAMTTAPQRIILGGGVIERRPALFERIRGAMVRNMASYGHTPAIADGIDRFVVPPMLGSMAGPLGALALASDALSHDRIASPRALAARHA